MTRPSFTWHLHWPTTLFVFALLPFLLGLGLWQLHRADEKRVLQQQFDALRAAPPLDAMALTDSTVIYTRVQLAGVFDNAHSFLLDNRVSRGRVGYDVLTPFTPVGQARTLLVNRGWIAGDPARQVLPVLPPVLGVVILQGYVYRDSDNRLIGGHAPDKHWPRVIEQVDVGAMQAQLGIAAYPYSLRLDADTTGALVAEWPVVASSPERHTAYAVQWIAMAAVLLLLWLFRSSNLQELIWRDDRVDKI